MPTAALRFAAARRDRPRDPAGCRVSDGDDARAMPSTAAPARRCADSAFVSRSAARPERPTNSRTRGSSASPRRRRRRVGRIRPAADDCALTRSARATRCRSGPTSCSALRAGAAARRVRAARRPRGRAAVRHQLSQAGRWLPALHRILQGRRCRARRLCTIHQGSIRQRLTRTVQGWMAEAGRRIRGIFR